MAADIGGILGKALGGVLGGAKGGGGKGDGGAGPMETIKKVASALLGE